MKIELKCACGATVELTDDRGSYINAGGTLDEKGRKFIIEKRADEWRDEHQHHATMYAPRR